MRFFGINQLKLYSVKLENDFVSPHPANVETIGQYLASKVFCRLYTVGSLDWFHVAKLARQND